MAKFSKYCGWHFWTGILKVGRAEIEKGLADLEWWSVTGGRRFPGLQESPKAELFCQRQKKYRMQQYSTDLDVRKDSYNVVIIRKSSYFCQHSKHSSKCYISTFSHSDLSYRCKVGGANSGASGSGSKHDIFQYYSIDRHCCVTNSQSILVFVRHKSLPAESSGQKINSYFRKCLVLWLKSCLYKPTTLGENVTMSHKVHFGKKHSITELEILLDDAAGKTVA